MSVYLTRAFIAFTVPITQIGQIVSFSVCVREKMSCLPKKSCQLAAGQKKKSCRLTRLYAISYVLVT